MLKNESARNATKPMPLRLSRLPDSGGIFTLSNRLRMEKISRSVRKVKQAKKKLLTVQSVQSVRTLTWHVRTATHGRSIQ
jgi:glucosamine 6-phosphate synthetase-like amidotransferase/phosphosugar isomerase protein